MEMEVIYIRRIQDMNSSSDDSRSVALATGIGDRGCLWRVRVEVIKFSEII